MRRTILVALRSTLIIVLSVGLASSIIGAITPNGNAGNYTVLASVQPSRYIVVDNNLQIQQIISNSNRDVLPYVVLKTIDGVQLPYTSAIRSQYLALKPSLNFSKAGVVYQRHTGNTLIGAAQTISSRILRFIFG